MKQARGVYLQVLAAPLVAYALLSAAPSGGALDCRIVAASAAYAVITAFLHELLHVLAALLLRVDGVRVRILNYLALLVLDYNGMTPRQFALVALAPQLLDIPLLLLVEVPALRIPAYISLLVNTAAGILDIINAVYVALVHRRAKRLTPLYDENGYIIGTVVEYTDRIIVYEM